MNRVMDYSHILRSITGILILVVVILLQLNSALGITEVPQSVISELWVLLPVYLGTDILSAMKSHNGKED